MNSRNRELTSRPRSSSDRQTVIGTASCSHANKTLKDRALRIQANRQAFSPHFTGGIVSNLSR